MNLTSEIKVEMLTVLGKKPFKRDFFTHLLPTFSSGNGAPLPTFYPPFKKHSTNGYRIVYLRLNTDKKNGTRGGN